MSITGFGPTTCFDWAVNRSERTLQVRWLVPLLAEADGRAWFLRCLDCACGTDEAGAAAAYHFAFPLRDLFTSDYYRCRGKPDLSRQFIHYYNPLLGLPEDFGVSEVWLTAPGGELRHPAAPGKAGWHEGFLQQRIQDDQLLARARDVARTLRTEADAVLITTSWVVLVECKYKGGPASEQYERHLLMGRALAARLSRGFHFGMVVEDERDDRFARLHFPYVRWCDIAAKCKEM